MSRVEWTCKKCGDGVEANGSVDFCLAMVKAFEAEHPKSCPGAPVEAGAS